MKRFPTMIAVAAGLIVLSGVAFAQWGPGMMGGGSGRGWRSGGAPCSGAQTTAAEITEEKAKELAQAYADKYLAGFTVDKVLPFTGMHHTMYSVELKSSSGEVRTLHINPFGNVMPFGGPWQRGT